MLVPVRESSRRIRSRGKLALASVATSSMSASTPAFSAVTLREPPRRKSPATTVWLPSRRLTSTLSPLTSNSVTRRAASAASLGESDGRGEAAGGCCCATAEACVKESTSRKRGRNRAQRRSLFRASVAHIRTVFVMLTIPRPSLAARRARGVRVLFFIAE
jgi:hypothetical protein